MHILHGTWHAQFQTFVLWGEDTGIDSIYRKGRRGRTAPHPYAMTQESLLRYISQYATDPQPDGDTITIWLPGVYKQPSPSMVARRNGATLTDTHPELLAWELEVVVLGVTDILDFLLQIPDANHGSFRLGYDLQFWQQATLLAMNCLVEGRYIPAMLQQGKQFRAYWQARPDDTLVLQLAQQMPVLCRAAVDDVDNVDNPVYLLNHFLSQAVDTFVREQYHPKKSPSHPWMKALLSEDRIIKGDFKHFKRVHQVWEQWQAVGSGSAGNFRIAFRLTEPDNNDGAWMLDYLLQAQDDPSLIVDAATVWQARSNMLHYLERRFDNPQEKLLAGLGLASRLFEPIDRSLRRAKPAGVSLDRDEAFAFLTEAAPLLENSGFGVLVPNWWGALSSYDAEDVAMQNEARVIVKIMPQKSPMPRSIYQAVHDRCQREVDVLADERNDRGCRRLIEIIGLDLAT